MLFKGARSFFAPTCILRVDGYAAGKNSGVILSLVQGLLA